MPSVPWKAPRIQDSVGCDYFRTLVIFQGADIYRFVGGIRPQVQEFDLRNANQALVQLKERNIRGAKVLVME